MKRNLVLFFQQFHDNSKLPRGTNSSFISLIPKVDTPQSLNEYRPISLIGCMYKILAKILALRLKVVLPYLVNERQMGFVEGMGLLQGAMVLNETLDEVRQKKKSCMYFKVDFEKAYDLVSWTFVLYMLRRFGFQDKWIGWIGECLRTSSMSVLVNGSPTTKFSMQKLVENKHITSPLLLRQGDPLALFLFVLVVEGLTGLVREASNSGLFRVVKVGSKGELVNILKYADDTIFVGEASVENVRTLKVILRGFELASGLC
uniref:LINE-1 reverse transcriptase isogeny n=1 Tax=Cajanus cajan TaxID=3821 RepID=A0A151T9K3_CAJCA|nr:LINE-1 reverse transcriptase isogeny [Cajanus cajan]